MFELIEFIVRVKVLFRRVNINDFMLIIVGNFVIDKNSYIVKINLENFILFFKEFELLFVLVSIFGKIFFRDLLIEDIWGYDFDGNERILDVYIGRICDRFF